MPINIPIYRVLLALLSTKSRSRLLYKLKSKLFGGAINRHDEYSIWLKTQAIRKTRTAAVTSIGFHVLIDGRGKSMELINRTFNSLPDPSHTKTQVTVLVDQDQTIVLDGRSTTTATHADTWLNQLPSEGYAVIMLAGDLLLEGFMTNVLGVYSKHNTSMVVYCDSLMQEPDTHSSRCYFKPDFSPYSLSSRNYIGRAFMVSNALLKLHAYSHGGFFNHHALLLQLLASHVTFHHVAGVYYSEVDNPTVSPTITSETVSALQGIYTSATIRSFGARNNYFDINMPAEGNPLVSVIIPTRNAAKICDTCLVSIFQQTTYGHFEVILIDNGSTESSFFEMVEKWQQREPDRFRTIREESDFNFSKLMNMGARVANGELLLLLNNDMEVISTDWMSRMVGFSRMADVGVVGAKLLYPNQTIQFAGAVLGLGDAAGHVHVGADRDADGYWGNLACLTEYSILTGACMMVSKELYWKVNGFDESLAVEFNDFDFCLKLQALGKHHLMIPQIQLYHHESISRKHPRENPQSYKRYIGELELFRHRWRKVMAHDPAYNPFLSQVFDDFRVG